MSLEGKLQRELFKFAFVRNPWQRVCSEYCYRQYDCSFDDFLLKRFPAETHENYANGDDLYRHIIPQSECIFDHKDVLKVDCIGRFETINEAFKALSLQLFGHDKLLPHVNKSSSKKVLNLCNKNKVDYQSAYSDKGVQFIEKFSARDIELLSYRFE
ncbi:sulfotransferase family protein [Pseudoalteromonas piscicida]|nr:sulfotransferase family protein [Pseudoalteromonas piscicida]